MKTMTKKLFLILSLFFSINAQAGILWFLLGAGAQSPKKEVVKTDFQVLVSSIEQKLPHPCNQTIYTSCWNQYKDSYLPFLIPNSSSEQIYSYFMNKGYKVVKEQDQLIFDFSQEHKKYLAHQKIWGSIEIYFLILMSLGFIAMFYLAGQGYRKKVKNIKRIYSLNQGQDLVFQNEDNKKTLEEHLEKNTIPAGWYFNTEGDQILRITKTSNHGIEAIATSLESYRRMFQPR